MKRVLFVDDSPTMVQAAYDELDNRGYMVDVAYNGQEALKFLRENAGDLPDLIIMDIEMPKLKGDEATRQIRENPAWTQIPIIALTAVSPEAMGAGLALFNQYLIKPFGFNEMLQMVEGLIGLPE